VATSNPASEWIGLLQSRAPRRILPLWDRQARRNRHRSRGARRSHRHSRYRRRARHCDPSRTRPPSRRVTVARENSSHRRRQSSSPAALPPRSASSSALRALALRPVWKNIAVPLEANDGENAASVEGDRADDGALGSAIDRGRRNGGSGSRRLRHKSPRPKRSASAAPAAPAMVARRAPHRRRQIGRALRPRCPKESS
jgi:hypothetical protein